MGTLIRDVVYAPEYGFRGEGDLFLPEEPVGAPVVLVIHGGGWQAMDRFRFGRVCEWLAAAGHAVFNINYRLTGDAPWPACGDDCLRAARFLLTAGHEAMAVLDRSRLAVLGGSAGGHLALMTGLRLPTEQVAGIVSLAGPTDLAVLSFLRGPGRFKHLFGSDVVPEEVLREASPVSQVTGDAPPLLCVHSTNDKLVPPEQSELIATSYRGHGRPCAIHSFAGEGETHGIWRPPRPAVPELMAHIEERIQAFLAACFN